MTSSVLTKITECFCSEHEPNVVQPETIHLRGKTNNCVKLYSSDKKRSFARKSGSITIFLILINIQ